LRYPMKKKVRRDGETDKRDFGKGKTKKRGGKVGRDRRGGGVGARACARGRAKHEIEK